MEQKQSLSIPLAIIIAGALIAGGIYWSGRGKVVEAPINTDNTTNSKSIEPIKSTDHVLGNPKAPLILVEHSDIECPFCKQFHNTLHLLMKQYGAEGKMAWVFRHFPVHTNSVKEAEATECAAEIGGNEAFWKYTDKIFEMTTSNNGLDLAELPAIASEIGLDVDAFNSCLNSSKYTAKIEKDRADVIAAGAQGTPYTVIFAQGQRIPITQGALPYTDMKTIIDAILKN